MRQGVLHSSRYSPKKMDCESLEAVFVGRERVMEDVLSRVSASIQTPEKHYVLLVGPRGSGKTHVLALAYHRLIASLDADDIGDRVAVALLKEEEWSIRSYLALTLRILGALADDAPQLDSQVAEIHARFQRNPADAEALATRLLRGHSEGKTLLVFCENLAELLRGLGDDGQKRWRAAIQEDGNWAIVATTSHLSAALTRQEYPFYGFFTIRALDKIDLQTGIELLARKAAHEDKPRLEAFLRTPLGRARARAVHHLAAGNHRAYAVLFDFLDKESLQDLVGPFMRMVDELTPYYQGIMRQLPPAQQTIVEYLCLEGSPSTVRDIATSCLMSQQTAAKQIGKLAKAGFISRNTAGRNTFCELSEPLMRICIEAKDNETPHFLLFVEFLRHWFTSRELQRQRVAYQQDAQSRVLDRIHVEEALRTFRADRPEPLLDALRDESRRCWEAEDFAGLALAQRTLARDGGDVRHYRAWVCALNHVGDSRAAIAAGREGLARHPEDGELLLELSEAYFVEHQFDEALATLDQSIKFGGQPTVSGFRADILLRLGRFEDAVAEAEAMLDLKPDHLHGYSQIIDGLVGLGQVGAAETRVRDLVRVAPSEPEALLPAARFHASQGRPNLALEYVERVLRIDAGHPDAGRLRGILLFDLEKYHSAAMELRLHASRDPLSVRTRCLLAEALLQSGEVSEAIGVAEQAIEIDPEHDHARLILGYALAVAGDHEEAMLRFEERPHKDHFPYLQMAATVTRADGNYQAAEHYLDRLVEMDPDDQESWIERCRLHIDQDSIARALESAERVEELSGSTLLRRLLAAEAIAADRPLREALEVFGVCVETEEYRADEKGHRDAIVAVLMRSAHSFGARRFSEGLTRLRGLLASLIDQGVLGEILTDLVMQDLSQVAGSSDEWENAFTDLASSLADLPDCQIPLGMLEAAVTFAKTGDQRRLLRLPLEQRQLLEEVLPSQGHSTRRYGETVEEALGPRVPGKHRWSG